MFNNIEEGIITILCNGDFSGRELARNTFTIGELEQLAGQREKAAATNSDPIR